MANGDEEEGWETVRRKKKCFTIKQGKMDIARFGWKDNGEKTNSFHFSEIPDIHSAKKMLKAFSYYGEVVEVVIPSKRNSRGLRFGFARFRKVSDPRTFAVKLDNIIIRANKFFVNIPKFQREKAEMPKGNVNGVLTSGGPRKTFGGPTKGGTTKLNGGTTQGADKWVWRVKEGGMGRKRGGEEVGVKKTMRKNVEFHGWRAREYPIRRWFISGRRMCMTYAMTCRGKR